MSVTREETSVIVEFTVPAAAFALGRALQNEPEYRIELEEIIPTTDAILPLFWVWGAELDGFEEALLQESAVESLTQVDKVEGVTLFRAAWNDHVMDLVHAINQSDATLLQGSGTATEWEFQLRFQNQEQASCFGDRCEENDLNFHITRIYNVSEAPNSADLHVTEPQQEALIVAHEMGYFQEPRETTLDAIAAELGITSQAVSGRLRRGTANLVTSMLLSMDYN